MKRKINKVKDVDAKESLNNERMNIKSHGLDTYDILKNPNYSDLILAMNAAAENVKKSRDITKVSNI